MATSQPMPLTVPHLQGLRRLCSPQSLRKMGARGPRSPPVPPRPLFSFFLLGSPHPTTPPPSVLETRGRGCHRPPCSKATLVPGAGNGRGTPFLGICSGFNPCLVL